MKKIYLLFIVAVFFVSCQGPIGPEGPAGYGTNWKIINLVVTQNDWVESFDDDGINRYYSSYFSMPEITSTVFNDGSVNAYVLIDNTQQPLPYVRHYEDINSNLWTRTVDYNFTQGGMNIFVTNSDFISDPPGTMSFRIVLMW
ncbi:MAG: hypothetical protein GZ091_11805 [Paludibacter sp.]|nr:hypothetical protein [Paludibacter sp.]